MTKLKFRKEFTTVIVTLIEEHRLTELQQIIRENSQPLPETAVRMGYRIYIEQEMTFRTRFFLIKKLREITKVEPDESIIHHLLRGLIGIHPMAVFKLVCDQLEIGIPLLKPLSRELQNWYQDLLDNGQYPQVSQLQEITGIPPDATLVQETYKKYLISGRLISYAGLSKQLGILPQPTMVQQVYSHFRQALAPNSQIPDSDRDNVQKWYGKIEAMTGIADSSPPS